MSTSCLLRRCSSCLSLRSSRSYLQHTGGGSEDVLSIYVRVCVHADCLHKMMHMVLTTCDYFERAAVMRHPDMHSARMLVAVAEMQENESHKFPSLKCAFVAHWRQASVLHWSCNGSPAFKMQRCFCMSLMPHITDPPERCMAYTSCG